MSTLTVNLLGRESEKQMKFGFAKSFDEIRAEAFMATVKKNGFKKFVISFAREAVADSYDSIRSRIDKKYQRRNEANILREWSTVRERVLFIALATVGTLALLGNSAPANSSVTTTAAATTIVATSVVPEVKGLPDVPQRAGLVYADPNYRFPHMSIETGPARLRRIDFGTSAFRNDVDNGGMYGRYLAIAAPGSLVSDGDYHRSLNIMFDRKEERTDNTPLALQMREQYNAMYDIQRTHMTIGQFARGIDMVVDEAYAGINFTELCADEGLQLNTERCAFVQSLAGKIHSEHLLAYMMTELYALDKKHAGQLNAWVLDMQLQHYGREALDLVPAQGDGRTSGGGWQFTPEAVGYDGDGPRPATVVSNYSSVKIPQSFIDFVRDDHERAAYYFAVYNIARLVRFADAGQYAALKRVVASNQMGEITEFIATSHHAQNGVRGYALAWLSAGASRPFRQYIRHRYVPYAERTRYNLPGVIAYLGPYLRTRG